MMKRLYVPPDLELMMFVLDDVCSDVIHSSFEKGGKNDGWTFNDDDDEDFGDLLP